MGDSKRTWAITRLVRMGWGTGTGQANVLIYNTLSIPPVARHRSRAGLGHLRWYCTVLHRRRRLNRVEGFAVFGWIKVGELSLEIEKSTRSCVTMGIGLIYWALGRLMWSLQQKAFSLSWLD